MSGHLLVRIEAIDSVTKEGAAKDFTVDRDLLLSGGGPPIDWEVEVDALLDKAVNANGEQPPTQ